MIAGYPGKDPNRTAGTAYTTAASVPYTMTVVCTCGTASSSDGHPHEDNCAARSYFGLPGVHIVHESSLEKSEPKGGPNNRAERRKKKALARRKPKLNKIQEARLNKWIHRLVSK